MILNVNPRKGAAGNRAKNFTNYVFGDVSGSGEKRIAEPQHLIGCEQPVANALGRILGVTGNNAVTTFNLCFEEKVSPTDLRKVMLDLHAMITVGIDPLDLVYIGGGHEKMIAQKASTDGHDLYFNLLLRSGIRWNPYYEPSDRGLFAAWTEITNYNFNFSSAKDEKKARLVVCVPNSDDDDEIKSAKAKVNLALTEFLAGTTHHKDDVVDFLQRRPDVKSVRKTQESLVLEMTDFSRDFLIRGSSMAQKYSPGNPLHTRKTLSEYEADFARWLEVRKKRHLKLYGALPRSRPLCWLLCLSKYSSDQVKAAPEKLVASAQPPHNPAEEDVDSAFSPQKPSEEPSDLNQSGPIETKTDDAKGDLVETSDINVRAPEVPPQQPEQPKGKPASEVPEKSVSSVEQDALLVPAPKQPDAPTTSNLPILANGIVGENAAGKKPQIAPNKNEHYKTLGDALTGEIWAPERTVQELLDDHRFIGLIESNCGRVKLTDAAAVELGKIPDFSGSFHELRLLLDAFSDLQEARELDAEKLKTKTEVPR